MGNLPRTSEKQVPRLEDRSLCDRSSARGMTEYYDRLAGLGANTGFGGDCVPEIFERHAQAGVEIDLWLPAQQSSRFGNVGTALLGIVLGKFVVTNLAFGFSYGNDALGAFENRELIGITNVHGKMFGRVGEPEDAVNLIDHVTKAARLAAVAIYGQVFTAQGLLHEVGNDAAIVQLHARAVGVEDANNAGIDAVITMASHGEGFGETLGFVINRTRAD